VKSGATYLLPKKPQREGGIFHWGRGDPRGLTRARKGSRWKGKKAIMKRGKKLRESVPGGREAKRKGLTSLFPRKKAERNGRDF